MRNMNLKNLKWMKKFDNKNKIGTRCLLMFFKAIGLAPYAVRIMGGTNLSKKANTKNVSSIEIASSRIGCIYNMLLVIGQFRMFLITVNITIASRYPDKTMMRQIIDIGGSVIGNTVIFAIWLILAFRQRTSTKLFNRLINTSFIMVSQNCVNHDYTDRRFIVYLFITNNALWIGLMSTEILINNSSRIHVWFSIILPNIIVAFFIIQYALTLKFVEKQFRSVNRKLADQTIDTIDTFDNTEKRFFIASEFSLNDRSSTRILFLRICHSNIYEVGMNIANFYSLPILLTIAYSSYILIYNAYYLVISVVFGNGEQTNLRTANVVLWLIVMMLPIIVLTFGVNKIRSEIKKTSDILRKLLTRSGFNESYENQLKLFVLELLHRKIRFTACGLFRLDCRLVMSIFSMVATYLIILIQFHVANNELCDPNI